MQLWTSGEEALLSTALVLGFVIGCGSTQGGPQLQGSGGSPATGGTLAMGGSGGQSATGSSASGGTTTTSPGGGSAATGGGNATGGRAGAGGAATGGTTTTGGRTTTSSTGGRTGAGGSGGTNPVATGGSTSQGGATGTGGGTGTGGVSGTGGSSTPDAGPGDAVARPDGGRDIASPPEAGPEARNDVSAKGDAPAYQPCPTNGDACKILPLGDSITFGVGDEGNAGYRGPLFALAVAAQQKITFTGSLSNGPSTVSGQTFPKKNEGHSGWGISQVTPYSGGNAGIATVIPSPAFSSGSGGLPNIVLLHIGTNDQGSFSAAQMTNDLKGLIDKIITNAPDALLVVAQIIPLGYGTNDVIKTYNQAIPGIVQERAAAGKHITILDMYTGFTPSTMLASDNIHPNTTGYKLMADRWYAAIGSYLPK